MIGLAASAPPDGLTRTSSPSLSALRRTTSCEVNGACNSAVSTGRSKAPAFSAASRVEGESVRSRTPRPWASMRWSMPRIQAGRAHSSRARVPRREDHGGGSVADGRAVAGTQGSYERSRPCGTEPRSWAWELAVGVRAAAGGDGGERGLVGVARVDEGLRLEGGEGDGVGPQGCHVVRVELAGQDVAHGAGRGLAVRVDERGVGLAGEELGPRLVQRPGAVHLDVRLGDRRPGADAVEGHGEGEGAAGEVVAGAGAGEADVRGLQAGLRRGPRAAPA